MFKRWRSVQTDEKQIADLRRETKLSLLTLQVLLSKGISTAEEMHSFLYDIPPVDPNTLDGMEKGVQLIARGVQQGQKIAVFGDYDVDGTCASAILIRTLRGMGATADPFVPDRHKDGYGLHVQAVENLWNQGYRLVVTVDNGIAAIDAVALAKKKGMEIVVTDHHLPGAVLPDADCIIDPHCSDREEWKVLCGAGVALLLSNRLEQCSFEATLKKYGQLAGLATVADVMPLTGINRRIVSSGLAGLRTDPMPGLKALLEAAGIPQNTVSVGTLGFALGPRINAAGRLSNAAPVIDLLIASQKEEAVAVAGELSALNRSRQEEERQILQDATRMIGEHPYLLAQPVLVLWKEGWNDGVVGIAASRLLDTYGKPTILLSVDGDRAKGSGRSRDDFDLFAAMQACSAYLTRFGGHKVAGGLSLAANRCKDFAAAMAAYAAERKTPYMPQTVSVCGTAMLEDFTLRGVEELEILAPYGVGNPTPVFTVSGLTVEAVTPLSNGRFAKYRVRQKGETAELLDFSNGPEKSWLRVGTVFDGAVAPSVNTFRGRKTVSLRLEDARPVKFSEERVIDYMAKALAVPAGGCIETDRKPPVREQLIPLYRHVAAMETVPYDPYGLSLLLWAEADPLSMAIGMQAMVDAGLFSYICGEQGFCVTINKNAPPAKLEESAVFQRIIAPQGGAKHD